MIACIPNRVLTAFVWRDLADAHGKRAAHYTIPARIRKDRGLPHPIEDFLFEYYPYPLAFLNKWHPGVGLGLEQDEAALPPALVGKSYSSERGVVFADPRRMGEKEKQRLRWVVELLETTQSRAPNFACHGLHEWAMVYRGRDVRHEETLKLRLPQEEIDALVESRAICCSHHDAFRFFAKEARPMNRLQPDLDSRVLLEQPGCVHANMDLYKWAAKAMPWVGSELLIDCFELAVRLRDLDMRASPYDLREWGREPVKIETAEGRRIYEIEQKELAAAARPLRERLIAGIRRALDWPA